MCDNPSSGNVLKLHLLPMYYWVGADCMSLRVDGLPGNH